MDEDGQTSVLDDVTVRLEVVLQLLVQEVSAVPVFEGRTPNLRSPLLLHVELLASIQRESDTCCSI